MTVGEICNREVVWLEREGSITEASRLMRTHHVGDVVIIEWRGDQPCPVGILTDRDIVVGLLAEGLAPDSVNASDLMSFELLTAIETDDLDDTVQHMRQRGVRRVPVVAADGALVGILTLDDMVEGLAEQLMGLVRLIRVEQHREQERRPD